MKFLTILYSPPPFFNLDFLPHLIFFPIFIIFPNRLDIPRGNKEPYTPLQLGTLYTPTIRHLIHPYNQEPYTPLQLGTLYTPTIRNLIHPYNYNLYPKFGEPTIVRQGWCAFGAQYHNPLAWNVHPSRWYSYILTDIYDQLLINIIYNLIFASINQTEMCQLIYRYDNLDVSIYF